LSQNYAQFDQRRACAIVLPCSLGSGNGALPSERAFNDATVFTAVDRVVRPAGCVINTSSCSSCHHTRRRSDQQGVPTSTTDQYAAPSR